MTAIHFQISVPSDNGIIVDRARQVIIAIGVPNTDLECQASIWDEIPRSKRLTSHGASSILLEPSNDSSSLVVNTGFDHERFFHHFLGDGTNEFVWDVRLLGVTCLLFLIGAESIVFFHSDVWL